MRKLKLQVQISIDGFVSTGPNDEQHWVTWAWEEVRPHVLGLLPSSDTILIGRKLAIDYIPYWEEVNTRPDDPMHEVAEFIVAAKKVVFTKTLERSEWGNTTLAKGNLADEVKALKQQEGKDILAYGGSSFVSSLIREGLVDEFHLFVNPVALGKGEPIFSRLEDWQQMTLKETIVYPCGIVMLHYQPK
ncbi:dihydrofolate reductase family protein [Chitinophaga barathri]|uniref:Dihydrofolate reductase n=1 Tax=Chitinophaga barathri TaxID=1647451 RepID=A0A3N4MEX9_9BACT|nr:dihydrofolate reductase family protein [Chitinophaga barathri]RPD42158.1 dihydrofolate reductase [Chitinophaga barathri]